MVKPTQYEIEISVKNLTTGKKFTQAIAGGIPIQNDKTLSFTISDESNLGLIKLINNVCATYFLAVNEDKFLENFSKFKNIFYKIYEDLKK